VALNDLILVVVKILTFHDETDRLGIGVILVLLQTNLLRIYIRVVLYTTDFDISDEK